MKRSAAFILCICMVLGLCACGDGKTETASADPSMTQSTSSQSSGTESTPDVSEPASSAQTPGGEASASSGSDSTVSNGKPSGGTNTSSGSGTQSTSGSKPSTGTTSSTGNTGTTSGAGSTSSADKPSAAPPETTVVNTYGNTESNLYNGGFVAGQGDWVYFVNPADNGYLYKMRTNGTGKQKLINVVPTRNINVVGDWVYFFNITGDDGYVYRVKTDGSESHRIFISSNIREEAGNVYVTDGYVNVGGYRRFRADFTETTEITKFVESAWSASFLGDEMYFIKYGLDGSTYVLWKSKLDGSEAEIYVDRKYYNPPLITEKYCVFNKDNRGVRVYDPTITNTILIPDNTLEPFVIDDKNDKIYYLSSLDNRLMRQDLITGEIKRYDVYATNINMIGDYIYYYNYDMAGKLYRIKTDGTGNEAV